MALQINAHEPFQGAHHEGHQDFHKAHKDFFVFFVFNGLANSAPLETD